MSLLNRGPWGPGGPWGGAPGDGAPGSLGGSRAPGGVPGEGPWGVPGGIIIFFFPNFLFFSFNFFNLFFIFFDADLSLSLKNRIELNP